MGVPPSGEVVTASVPDTLAVLAEVIVPTLAKGVIVRRPHVVAAAERLDLDARAVKRLQHLRRKYGPGPVLLPIPGRMQAIILEPDHVHAVLAGAPVPFSPASAEKRSALAHFEPEVSLISTLPERTDRRRLNEDVLEAGCPVHPAAAGFLSVVADEAGALLARLGTYLRWADFNDAWHRMVRRVVLGDGARDDHELTDMLAKLRAVGNWGFLHPGRDALREQFHHRLQVHLGRAETGSLAERIARAPKTHASAPADQATQYLFAFDPAGMATFRTLALLATHPAQAAVARREIAAAHGGLADLSYLRACVVDCVRLWPTTPAILRETTQDVAWPGGVIPKNTSMLIFTPYFHRDRERLDYADRFAPEIWMHKAPDANLPLVPFSAGPAVCPARHLVPMLASAFIANILRARELAMTDERLDPAQPLPGTFNAYSIVLRASPPPDR